MFLWQTFMADLTKEPSDWPQKQGTGGGLRKIKKPFSCSLSGGSKFSAAGWIRNTRAPLPSLIDASVHLLQSDSLSLSEESFYQPPALWFYSPLWAVELLDQGRGSARGVRTLQETCRATRRKLRLIPADDNVTCWRVSWLRNQWLKVLHSGWMRTTESNGTYIL